jgi:hypothetical protein
MNACRFAWGLALALATATPAWAQGRGGGVTLEGLLGRLNGGELIGALAVTLIFGTGLVAVLTGGLASIVKAFNGADDENAMLERLDALDARLERIEQKLGVGPGAGPLETTLARGD